MTKQISWLETQARAGGMVSVPAQALGNCAAEMRAMHAALQAESLHASISEIEGDLTAVLGRHGAEIQGPDFIVARYLMECLSAYNQAVESRQQWGKMEPDFILDAPMVSD